MRKQLGALLFGLGAGCIATFFYFGHFENIADARGVILSEYLRTYCAKPAQGDMMHAGAAAVLSRLTIATGIGERALAEYYKQCGAR